MKTKILKIKGDWQDVVDDCRSTVSKSPLGHEPSTQFKKDILMAEHTPIRDIIIRWKWDSIKSWIATHFARHHHLEPRISTQRNDRQNKYDRNKAPQDADVIFTAEGNIQACIDMERKRLCNQADPETKQYAEDLKYTLHDIEPEISEILVPNCVYRGNCCEGKNNCGWYTNFLKRHPEINVFTSLQKRYDIYNKEFYSKKGENYEQ